MIREYQVGDRVRLSTKRWGNEARRYVGTIQGIRIIPLEGNTIYVVEFDATRPGASPWIEEELELIENGLDIMLRESFGD